MPDGTVVVGIDGSANAEHALRWAVGHAGVLGRVTPVVVYQASGDEPSPGRDAGEDPADPNGNRKAAEARLCRVIDAVDPGLHGAGLVVEGHPGAALVEAGAGAELLVVGTRGQSGLTSSVLGSVSSYCATSATVPVAIIPTGSATDRPLTDLVVGVDGSPHADAALRWAIDHLAPGGRLRAVGALPIWGEAGSDADSLDERLGDRVEAAIERVMADIDSDDETDRDTAPATNRAVGGGEREIVITTAARDARVVLREAAEAGGDLLVIGRRGLSRLAFLVLGSVASAVTHHPTVPTVVIPTAETTPPDES